MTEFAGFVIPEKNYFHMPNEWVDICAEIDNLAELKVIQYVLRHTWGFHEYGIPKTISVDEFMHGRKRTNGTRIDSGTGLKSDRSVKDGLKAAIEHGYLIYEVDTSDPARTRKSYALKMIETGVDTTPQVDTTPLHSESTGVDTTYLAGSIYPPDRYNLPPYQVDTTPRSEKDTKEKHLEKDTKEKQSCDVADATITADVQSSSDLSQDEQALKDAFMAKARVMVEEANNGTRRKTFKATLPKAAKPEPTPEEQAFQARCSALQAQINEWRGYPLTTKGPIINEHKAIRTLAEMYTDEQIAKIREYLFNKHWRYSKPDNRYTIGAQIILDEAGNVQQILKHPQTSAVNGHSPPGSNGAKPRPSALVSEEQAARNKARLYERAEAVRAELIRQGKPVPGQER